MNRIIAILPTLCCIVLCFGCAPSLPDNLYATSDQKQLVFQDNNERLPSNQMSETEVEVLIDPDYTLDQYIHSISVNLFISGKLISKEMIESPSPYDFHPQLLTFSVKDVYRGYYADNEITVKVSADSKYSVGGEYFLPLHAVFDELDQQHDYYISWGGLVIPMHSLKSSVCDMGSLAENTKGLDLTTATEEEFVDFVVSNMEYEAEEIEPISSDMKEIIDASSCVAVIEIKSLYVDSHETGRMTYECEILDAMKDEIGIDKTAIIVFPADKVDIGDTVIVGLIKPSENTLLHIITSKDAIFDVSKKSEIRAMLE